MNIDQNAKKGPLTHQKMKCSFLDYFQLLMIGQAIWAMNIDQNAKKAPKSLKNEMFILDYVQLLKISRAIQAMKVDQNVKKYP